MRTVGRLAVEAPIIARRVAAPSNDEAAVPAGLVIHCRPRTFTGSSVAHWLLVGSPSAEIRSEGEGLTHPGFSWSSLQHPPPGSFRSDRRSDMGLVLEPAMEVGKMASGSEG